MRETGRHQEVAHGAEHDYRAGSPHLKHARLNDRLMAVLREVLDDLNAHGLPPFALDVGAGDGAMVEPMLAYGWRVSATEMSRPSIERLRAAYGDSPSFTAVLDQEGELAPLGNQRFSLILYASVLHHIPDYLKALEHAIDRHLARGGAVVSIQDPLWYPTLPTGVHALSEVAFLSWRLSQGNYLRGIRSRLRRARRAYDDTNPSDTVEYHVVRQGVDQAAIRDLLAPRFQKVRIIEYWSSQARFWQRLGDLLSLGNTFAMVAQGFEGADTQK